MNKHVYSLTALFAAIALMTISCGKDKEVDSPDKPGASVEHEAHIIAQDGDFTKTLVAQDGNGYISKWEAEDNVALFQSYELSGTRSYLDAKFSTTTTLNSEKTKADFTVVLDEVQGASNYKYVTAYPTTAVTRDGSDLNFVIPSEQTFGTTSFDKNADVMVSQMVSRPTFSTDALEMGFARIGAIVKMTVTGLTAGETVQSVVFSTTEEGKYFAGTIKYDMTTQKLKDGITAGAQTLTLNAPENTTVPANGSLDVWFRSAVVTLENNFTVVVNTLDGTTPQVYTKKVDLTDKTFAFNSGKLAKFSVGVFHKVIEEGYYLVSYSGKMMTVGTAGNSYRGCEDLVENNIIKTQMYAVWDFVFDAKTGKYTIRSISTDSYLQSTSSTTLNLSNTGTAFSITKSEGKFRIANKTIERYLGYNHNNGNPRFGMYQSPNNQSIGIDLDLDQPVFDKKPVLVIADITLSSFNAITNPVTITPTSAYNISSITVNGCYSDSQCTQGNEVDWVSVEYSSGVLSYTVQENPNKTVRTAYIKVTGVNEDNDETVVVFSITQPKKVVYADQWVLLTNIDNLSVGDKIVIVSTNGTKALGTTQNNNNRSAVDVQLDVDDNNIVKINDQTQQLIVGSRNSHWTFYTGSGYLYAASSSNNYLKTETELDTNGEWTIELNNDSEATIKAQGSNTRNLLKNNGDIFSCYASGQTAVKIYKFIEDTTSPKITALKTSFDNVQAAAATNVIVTGVYTLANAEDNNLTITPDGTVVTSASASNGDVTYSIAANSGASRQGTISITVAGGNSIEITVKQLGAAYALTLANVDNGTVSATVGGEAVGGNVPAGETVNLVATASTSGYKFKEWDVYKTSDSSVKVSVSNNSFVMPEYPVTVSATFVQAGEGTLENPFSVAEAIAEIDGGSTSNVYVKGILCTEGNSYCFISDDGTTTTRFELYNISGSISSSSLKLGDGVLAHGTLKKYSNTYEFNGCVVDIQVKKPTFTPQSGAEFIDSQSIAISSTGSTSIRYTTDGVTVPTSSVGDVYASPLNITSTTTVQAVGINGVVRTAVATASFTKVPPVFGASLASTASTESLDVTANTTSATVYVTGNVPWTATAGDGVSFASNEIVTEKEDNGATSFTIYFEANTDVNGTKANTVTITTTADVATKSYTLTVTQEAKPSGTEKVAIINFGSGNGNTKIEGKTSSGSGTVTYTDTGNDSEGNTWTITTVTSKTKSFTQSSNYSQIGSSNNPVTSITFTTTLAQPASEISLEAKFGGFSSTAGTINLKVGDTSIGSGALNGTTDVTVQSTSTGSGTVLTVTVTNIAKGVKAYYIKATYITGNQSSNSQASNINPVTVNNWGTL